MKDAARSSYAPESLWRVQCRPYRHISVLLFSMLIHMPQIQVPSNEQQPHGAHRQRQEDKRHDAPGADVVGVAVAPRRHEKGVDLVGGEHERIGGTHRDEQRQGAAVYAGLFPHDHHQRSEQHGCGDVGHEQREERREQGYRDHKHDRGTAGEQRRKPVGDEDGGAALVHGRAERNEPRQ